MFPLDDHGAACYDEETNILETWQVRSSALFHACTAFMSTVLSTVPFGANIFHISSTATGLIYTALKSPWPVMHFLKLWVVKSVKRRKYIFDGNHTCNKR